MSTHGLVLGVAVLLVLAGCAGNGDVGETLEDDFDAPPVAESGVVKGRVLDAEDFPVAGAEVGLTPSGVVALTDASGAYRFNELAPGAYTLNVQKLGYESLAVRVTVEAGKTLERDVRLVPLQVVDAYHLTKIYRGELTCSFSTLVWVSPCDYPYTAVYYTLHGLGVNLSQYGVPAEPLANKWRWNTEIEEPEDLTGVVTELTWTPTSAAAEKMMVYVSCAEFDPVLDDCDGWGFRDDGPAPVVRLEWKPPEGEDVFMTRVYLPWGDAHVALNQKYENLHTFFYGAKPPKDYSALPDEP